MSNFQIVDGQIYQKNDTCIADLQRFKVIIQRQLDEAQARLDDVNSKLQELQTAGIQIEVINGN